MKRLESLKENSGSRQEKYFVTPILFLVFNRPESTRKVFEAIRKIKPLRLYVASDGARIEKKLEDELVLEVREIVAQTDWECEVNTLYREKNLGCKKAISEAITWFFNHEEEGIILEDDCLPDQSFFWYCKELLCRYRNNKNIMTVGGVNYQNGAQRGEGSYYGTKYFHCWGWASWRRAWLEYDLELETIEGTVSTGLVNLSDGNPFFIPYWNDIISECVDGRNSSWAYPMSITCFARIGAGVETMHLAPQVNLVENIGFKSGGTHTNDKQNNPSSIKHSINFPLKHPECLIRDVTADKWTDEVHFQITFKGYLKRKIGKKFPKFKKMLIWLLRKR